MTLLRTATLRIRLTLWYVAVLAIMLVLYAVIVFGFQYVSLTRQLLHDEIQDVVTVEGLLYFDGQGQLKLHQDYYSRPQSHLLIDRLMEVRDEATGGILYSSSTLGGMPLGGPLRAGEGDRDFSERLVRLQDGRHVFLVSHIHGLGGHQLVIRLGYDLGPLHERLVQFCLLLALGIPLGLVLAGLAGQAIAARALRPLKRMATRAEGITATNLHDRLDVPPSDDELGHMANVFNQLLQRLEESFTQLKRFTADAAHELRTPLASVRAMGEIALQAPRSAEAYKDTLSDILEETGKLGETIDSLLLLARAEAMQSGQPAKVFSIRLLVGEVLTLLEVITEERSLRVLELDETGGRDFVSGDWGLLRVVILNILHNAVKFSPPGSTLRITYGLPKEDAAVLRILFQDQGPGITAGEEYRVFDRFFTSSASATAADSGAGLGLAIAKLIVERSSGSISFDAHVRGGARCVVDLPRQADALSVGDGELVKDVTFQKGPRTALPH
jgi:signal transduction histidine kinase